MRTEYEQEIDTLVDRVQESIRTLVLALRKGGPAPQALESLKTAILENRAMEEINRVALSHVQMEIGDHARGWKFFVRPSGVEVTDLLWLLEDIDIPEPIRLSIPTLTQAEWEAALRFSFLFIGSFHVAVDPSR